MLSKRIVILKTTPKWLLSDSLQLAYFMKATDCYELNSISIVALDILHIFISQRH